LAVQTPSFADALYLAGSEFSPHSDYAFLGTIGTIGAPTLQNGIAYRLWADHVAYQYKSGQTTHHASANGIEGGLGSLFAIGNIQASIFLSATVRDTHISPADSSNTAEGTKSSAKISGDFSTPVVQTVISNFSFSYSPTNDGYWARLRLAKDMGSYWLGPEFSTSGDNTYSVKQFGLSISKIRISNIELGVKSGIRKEKDISAKPYIGVELSSLF